MHAPSCKRKESIRVNAPAPHMILAPHRQIPQKKTEGNTQRLMDYLATYLNAYIRFYASGIVLHIDTDASYLVLPNAKSRIAEYFHLIDLPSSTVHPNINGPILVEYKTLYRIQCT